MCRKGMCGGEGSADKMVIRKASAAQPSFLPLARLIHCTLNMPRRPGRGLNAFGTLEWEVSDDDAIDSDESMPMSQPLISQEEMRPSTPSDQTELQIDDPIEISSASEVSRSPLSSINAENAGQDGFASSNDLEALSNGSQLLFDSDNEASSLDDDEDANLFIVCFSASAARN